jgi:hypothetical protein
LLGFLAFFDGVLKFLVQGIDCFLGVNMLGLMLDFFLLMLVELDGDGMLKFFD